MIQLTPAMRAAVDRLVGAAPPFTAQQQRDLRRIFAPAVAATTAPGTAAPAA